MVQRISQKAGMAFGEQVYVGEGSEYPVEIDLTVYSEQSVTEFKNTSLEFIKEKINGDQKCWIHVRGVHDVTLVSRLASMFGFHMLQTEDILNTDQQPKFEEHYDHLYFALKFLHGTNKEGKLTWEQIAIVLGENYVISFQESYKTLFTRIYERITVPGKRMRTRGPDYLFYGMIDFVIDHYYRVFEELDEEQDDIEAIGFDNPNPALLDYIISNKQKLASFRRLLNPLKDALFKLQKQESDLVEERHGKYLNDAIDHVKDIYERVEWLREMNAGYREAYNTAMNERMNKVMQLLTIIATIFIPLTFIAGIYGMNFENMPELQWDFGYPMIWIVMIAIALLMVGYFKRKRWF